MLKCTVIEHFRGSFSADTVSLLTVLPEPVWGRGWIYHMLQGP